MLENQPFASTRRARVDETKGKLSTQLALLRKSNIKVIGVIL